MESSEQTAVATTAKSGGFDATHWSLVRMAGQSSPQAEAALGRLCQTYWYPLYVFIRRQGHSPEDAQDLVQGFFAQAVQKRYFQDADRAKGKCRSFLLLALKSYMANEWDRANRLKRGGGQEVLSLDAEQTESRYLAEPADWMSPEKAFERQWAMTLLAQVLKRVEAEFAQAGKGAIFDQLKVCLSGEKSANSYAEIGAKLGMSVGAVKVAVHRLRHRYREVLREEIASTVDSPEAVEDEIRELFTALS
jgi:RNA polymerase sigma factor (sigma-70 family)